MTFHRENTFMTKLCQAKPEKDSRRLVLLIFIFRFIFVMLTLTNLKKSWQKEFLKNKIIKLSSVQVGISNKMITWSLIYVTFCTDRRKPEIGAGAYAILLSVNFKIKILSVDFVPYADLYTEHCTCISTTGSRSAAAKLQVGENIN